MAGVFKFIGHLRQQVTSSFRAPASVGSASALSTGAASLPPDAFEDKLKRLALIAGDYALTGSSFEGGNPNQFFYWLTDVFKSKKEAFEQEGFNVDEFLEKIKDQWPTAALITALDIGKSVILKAGWSGINDGHAILIEIKKTSPTTFSFILFNRGEGAHYHEHILDGKKIKAETAFVIEGVSSERISDSLLQFIDHFRSSLDDDCPRVIYEALVSYLKGKKASSQKKGKLAYSTLQRSGTCPWKPWMSAIKYHAKDYESFRKVKHLLWISAFESVKEHLHHAGPEFTQMLLFVSQKFARSVTKSFNMGLLEESELKRYDDFIKEFQEKIPKHRLTPTPFEIQGPPLDTLERTPLKSFTRPHPFQGCPPHFMTIQSLEKPKTAQDLIRCIRNFNSSSHFDRDLRLFSLLPVPALNSSDLWDEIPQEEILIVSNRLLDILYDISSKGCSLRVAISYHIMAILDKLRKRSPESEFDRELVIHMIDIKDAPNLSLETKTQEDLEYRKLVNEYFESKIPSNQKLFYFNRRGYSRKFHIDLETRKTPFEHYLFKIFARYEPNIRDKSRERRRGETPSDYFLHCLFKYLPKIDAILLKAFLETYSNTTSQLYNISLDGLNLSGGTFNYLSAPFDEHPFQRPNIFAFRHSFSKYDPLAIIKTNTVDANQQLLAYLQPRAYFSEKEFKEFYFKSTNPIDLGFRVLELFTSSEVHEKSIECFRGFIDSDAFYNSAQNPRFIVVAFKIFKQLIELHKESNPSLCAELLLYMTKIAIQSQRCKHDVSMVSAFINDFSQDLSCFKGTSLYLIKAVIALSQILKGSADQYDGKKVIEGNFYFHLYTCLHRHSLPSSIKSDFFELIKSFLTSHPKAAHQRQEFDFFNFFSSEKSTWYKQEPTAETIDWCLQTPYFSFSLLQGFDYGFQYKLSFHLISKMGLEFDDFRFQGVFLDIQDTLSISVWGETVL